MARFGRVVTAMVTPFAADGSLDVDEAVRLARWLAGNGNDGLVVSGTTGESSTLTDEEKLTLWREVAAAVTIPVIAGTGSNDTAHSVHLTAEASRLGIAGVLGGLGHIVPALADKAALARIGHYYATESMLWMDPATGRYDADHTPSFGSDRFLDFQAEVAAGRARVDRGDHAVF